ncbi:hypothetical protein QJ856_gp1065 [Tupanvirus deep ocean]|uniref:Uncharacterized protein n=2 Tax=Tupanvirus TaxID=2094720 RepID=A0AC62A7D5_9VIRU|nr:hypothetical protein QJ856_gp1065 [Tupanvirus deep ocean]QKU33692.1 hypothetical protein [Tupanvirus deep ocean]
MGENMYCGIGPIPKGKVRGTPEYCVQTNQIRYYGLEPIDEDLLKQAKGKTSNLQKEQLKLKKIQDDAKLLIKEVKNLKVILDDENIKPGQQKRAQKRMDDLLVKRDKLVKKLNQQTKVVEIIEENEKKRSKAGSKTTKSSSSKAVKSSSSKTTKSSGSKKSK